jgi:hypothetical protein
MSRLNRRSQEFCADGLFSHTKAEAALQQLFDTVFEQQNEIDRLRNEVSELGKSVKEWSLNDMSNDGNLHHSIRKNKQSLKERVARLERCTALPESDDSGTSLTVGEAVILNQKAVSKALQALSSKVGVQELLDFQEAQRQLVNEAKKDLSYERTSRETILSLSDCVCAINEKLDTISSDLQSKAGKAAIKSIQADASLIRDRVKTFQNIEEEVNSMRHKIKQADMQLSDYGGYIADLSATSKAFREELGEKVDKTEFQKILANMDEIRKSLNILKSENAEASKVLSCSTTDIHKLFKGHQDLQMLSESRWQKCREMQLCTYTKDELDTILSQRFMCKSDLELTLNQVREDLDKKACVHNVSEQRCMIDNLALDHADTKKAALLAAKFIDWYSRRGESFEHNAQTIDNELKRLARRSAH